MLDWDKLRVFYAVAQANSFTHAGDTLHLSQSAVSRQISALEESIGVILFHRHARGLLLTEQGEILLKTVREVYGRLAAVEDAVRESKDRPKGPLKVSTPVTFGTTWLTPRIREFNDLYPEIEINLLLDDSELDLSMREADVAIRPYPPSQPDLIQRHLQVHHNSLFASESYLKIHGTPQVAEDLTRHRMIAFGDDSPLPFSDVNWHMEVGLPRGQQHKPVFRANTLLAMLEAVKSGLGICALPNYMVDGVPNIRKILPEIEGATYDTYFVYPSELKHSKRVTVFRDYLVTKMAETSF